VWKSVTLQNRIFALSVTLHFRMRESVQLAQKEKSVGVSVHDQSFIDRPEVRDPQIVEIPNLLAPPMVRDHGSPSAAYRIKMVRGADAIIIVATGNWVSIGRSKFYFSCSCVLQDANGSSAPSGPDLRVSTNQSLRALAGQLVSEGAMPPEQAIVYLRRLISPPRS
jgi:hypothetical protein